MGLLLLNRCLVGAPQSFRARSSIPAQIAVRYASLNSAISKGVRKGRSAPWEQRGQIKKFKEPWSSNRSSNDGEEGRFSRKNSADFDRSSKPRYDGARQGGKRIYGDENRESSHSGDRSFPWQQRNRVNRTDEFESSSRYPRKPFQGRGGDRRSEYESTGKSDREVENRYSRKTFSDSERYQGRGGDRRMGTESSREWDGEVENRRGYNDRNSFHRPAPWLQRGRIGQSDSRNPVPPRYEQGSSVTEDSSSSPTRRRKSVDREPMHWRVKSKRKGPREQVDLDEPVSFVSKVSVVGPRSVPYTSPVSEFIYGYSAVRAAVRSGRRQIHVLYIYYPDADSPKWSEPQANGLQKFAGAVNAKVKLVSGNWLKTLDKMSEGRPHNGFIAEVSPLPKLPALSYEAVPSMSASHFNVNVASQSKEEADVNGTDGRIPLASREQDSQMHDAQTQLQASPRYPFTLLLDGILDPGNLGAIIRSAYFFGVDAVAFSSRNSAPLSPVTIKASAGAAENIPLISIHDTPAFVEATRKNGWRFFAAEPPAPTSETRGGHADRMSNIPVVPPFSLSEELRKSPCVLMLGGEGTGLSKTLKRKADAFVAIPGAQTATLDDDPAELDSLNVSVASGLLCEAFLREPSAAAPAAEQPVSEQDQATDKEADEERVF